MNINLLSLSNNKKSSHICVKYGSEDVYTAGESANCDLTPNWAVYFCGRTAAVHSSAP